MLLEQALSTGEIHARMLVGILHHTKTVVHVTFESMQLHAVLQDYDSYVQKIRGSCRGFVSILPNYC